MDKVFETNSRCHVKKCAAGKVDILFFRSFLLVLAKFSFWEEGWALDYSFMKFESFLIFPYFLRS